jgi:hypothetical protein
VKLHVARSVEIPHRIPDAKPRQTRKTGGFSSEHTTTAADR